MAMKRKITTCKYAYDVTKLLAHTIKKKPEYADCKVDTYGPFGLKARCSVAVTKPNGDVAGFLTVCYNVDDKASNKFTYETSKTIAEYSKDSIGELNGFNIIEAPLPNDLEEAVNLVFNHD